MKTVTLKKANVLMTEAASGGMIISEVAPAFVGNGDTNYLCAGCNTVLMEKMEPGQISGGRIKCPCGTVNMLINTL